MRGRRGLWVTGVVCFVAGVLLTWLGADLYVRPTFRMLQECSFLEAASGARVDVANLEKLRAGETSRTIEALEGNLDSRLIALSAYEDTVPAKNRDRYIYESLRRIASYRKANPRPTRSDPDMADVEASISKALQMGGSESGSGHAP